jgi:uncharacterized membrane protein YhaH (DUF805 family)
MVSLGQSVINFWTKYFDFSGTAQRSEYWWVLFANISIMLALMLLSVIFFAASVPADVESVEMSAGHILAIAPVMIFVLAAIFPAFALYARRLHDVGLSAWWLLLFALSGVPVVGHLVSIAGFIVIGFLPSDTFKPNKYRKK